jgi:CubicO group peptidase (beta-lactamase class C family)
VGVPGTDISIYLKGKEVYRHQVGFADLETKTSVNSNTLYEIWSMTKIITCVAALRLYEQGLFLLTDPLHVYIPSFKNMMYRKNQWNGTVDIVPCTSPIRIADLFTMSSGLTYDFSDDLLSVRQTAKSTSLLEFTNALSKEPLYFEPGTRWHYGLSHDVLGALIETLTGKTLGDYFKSEIFQPLGMDNTFFDFCLPEEKIERLASVYIFDEDSKTHKKINQTHPSGSWGFESGGGGLIPIGGGGLISSIDDYIKFANTLCNGGTSVNGHRLLGAATIELMCMNHLNKAMMHDYNYGHQIGYGYGLGVRTMMDRAAGGSNSTIGEFGWAGRLGTYVSMDPVSELAYIYAYHLMPSKEDYIAPRLRNIIYACL